MIGYQGPCLVLLVMEVVANDLWRRRMTGSLILVLALSSSAHGQEEPRAARMGCSA